MQQTVTREDVEVVRTIWCDHFKESLASSQYAAWLRLYSPDIVAEGIQAGHRRVVQVFNTDKRMTSKDVIRYSFRRDEKHQSRPRVGRRWLENTPAPPRIFRGP